MKILEFIIKTNLWVAICFTSLLVFFQINLYETNYYVWGIAFFGTLAIYTFTRIGDWRNFFRSDAPHLTQVILTIIGCIGAFICVLLRGFEFKTFLYLAVLGFISFCYSLPFSGLGLRAIPFLKLFLISFVWAGSSIGLLLIVHHDFLQHEFLFFSVFFYVFGITIPFDIRDSDSDEKELKTIPQVVGIIPSKILSIGCLLISWLLFYAEAIKTELMLKAWSFTLLLALILVIYSSTKRKEHYYSFWIEGCSILPLAIYCGLKYFE